MRDEELLKRMRQIGRALSPPGTIVEDISSGRMYERIDDVSAKAEPEWWKSVTVTVSMPTMMYMGRMIAMPSLSGHGRWRMKGRGRRLKCASKLGPPWDNMRFHRLDKQCRWCGVTPTQMFSIERGFLESFRFLTAIESPAIPSLDH